MTSGQFHTAKLDQIQVDRPGRQRRELDDIEELADSINRLGLIHPLVVTRDLQLVAGERRLNACRSLGWDSIPVQYADEVDPRTLRAIELEENVKRKALPWADECRAVHEYHVMRKEEEPEWSGVDTAKALGLSVGGTAEKLRVAEELLKGNERVVNAPKFSTAKGIVQRSDERIKTAQLAEVRGATPKIAEPESILVADFNTWAQTYDGPPFNFIHCDFPYGIGADKFNQGAAPLHGGYEDEESTYFDLLGTLSRNIDRVVAPSAHIMFWFSMHFYSSTLDFFLRNTDFRIDPFPLVWTKSDNIGILPDPQRGPRRIYETCLFGSRGDRKVVGPVSNGLSFPSQRDAHMSIKPQGMLEHFFRMFVDSSSSVLDPTCGSGGALRAAESLGAKRILGLEANPEFAERARLALKTYRQQRRNGNEGTSAVTPDASEDARGLREERGDQPADQGPA